MASSIEQLDTFAPSLSFRPCAAVFDVPNIAPETSSVPEELLAEDTPAPDVVAETDRKVG